MITAELLAAAGAGLVALTAVSLLVMWSWRLRLLALTAQYVGVFLLVDGSWPVELALTKLIAGWIVVIVLWTALAGQPEGEMQAPRSSPRSSWLRSNELPGAVLRFLAALMLITAAVSILPLAVGWLGSRDTLSILGGLILLGLGMLHLGMSARPFGVCLGLLTVSSGFEVLYAVVETSAMVAGLQAAINLGLSLAISYILIAPVEDSA